MHSPKRQDRQRPVRLVAQPVRHRIAPEIVAEQLPQRRRAQHVLVLHNHAHIVVHKVAGQTVRVAQHSEHGHHAVGGQRRLVGGGSIARNVADRREASGRRRGRRRRRCGGGRVRRRRGRSTAGAGVLVRLWWGGKRWR